MHYTYLCDSEDERIGPHLILNALDQVKERAKLSLCFLGLEEVLSVLQSYVRSGIKKLREIKLNTNRK